MNIIFPSIAILGHQKDTLNYELALSKLPVTYHTCLTKKEYQYCDGLLLPGGGDVHPQFFHEENIASRSIDLSLDLCQFEAMDFFCKQKKPILGICKGMQVINIYFGGNIYQDLAQAKHHEWIGADQIHPSIIFPNTPLYTLYGSSLIINSAHHQGLHHLGRNLKIMQQSDDLIIEGIYHSTLPILGVQWHPERYVAGMALLQYFVSLLPSTNKTKT